MDSLHGCTEAEANFHFAIGMLAGWLSTLIIIAGHFIARDFMERRSRRG